MKGLWFAGKTERGSDVGSLSYGALGVRVHSRRRVAMMLAAMAGLGISPSRLSAAEGPIKIVALGDSLTAGYGLPAQDAFPVKLQRALKDKGIAAEIGNAGVSGDTASGGLSRLDWAVPEGTEAVIVELGANDMLRGVDPAVTRKALDAILTKLKSRNIDVLLCGMRAAPNMGPDYVREYEKIFTDLARKHDVLFYPFFLEGIAAQAKFSLRDGVHPNAAGVSAIVTGILPDVEKLIAKVRGKRGS